MQSLSQMACSKKHSDGQAEQGVDPEGSQKSSRRTCATHLNGKNESGIDLLTKTGPKELCGAPNVFRLFSVGKFQGVSSPTVLRAV